MNIGFLFFGIQLLFCNSEFILGLTITEIITKAGLDKRKQKILCWRQKVDFWSLAKKQWSRVPRYVLLVGDASLEDLDGLINGLLLPFFVNMICLNGFFQNPYGETLAEALIKASGGGLIAIWTSSGLTEPDKQALMNKELIKLLFNGQSLTIGEASAKAKASVSDQDIRKTWILFGDPTQRLTR